jgi:SEC-C motif-containing protein
MRSRYTAYVLRDEAYLLATWHAAKRPPSLVLDEVTRWLGLTVKSHRRLNESEATVAFVARYRDGSGKGHRLEEMSHFVLEEGRWYYVSAMHA